MDIVEAIEARSSVRTFVGEPLCMEQIKSINLAMSRATYPLHGSWSMELRRFELTGPLRPGTYGFIKGAVDFMLLGFDGNNHADAVAAGFAMEQVVLACTQMGLGTCWMAGTFKATDFCAKSHFPDGMGLQAVIPVGTAAGRTRFIERVTRFAMGSRNRKPVESLFFAGDWNRPMADCGQFYEPLMMMRLAPSSTNSQPWRALIDGDAVHFYCKDATRVHMIDMGIGMCHFDMTGRYRGITGHWTVDSSMAPVPAGGMVYVATYIRN